METHYGSTGVLPFVPGVDGVGRLADGRRVFFGAVRSPFGTFAERTVASGAMCLEVPEGLEDAVAAGLGESGDVVVGGVEGAGEVCGGGECADTGGYRGCGAVGGADCQAAGCEEGDCGGTESGGAGEVEGAGGGCVISLEQEKAALVEAFRGEIAGGVDVVLDYLWGAPAESVLAAIAKKGLSHSSPRIRFVQIGNSAGATITLAGATLRSSGLELLGSGFGSASLAEIFAAVGEFFKEAAARPFDVEIKVAALKDVEAVWGEAEKATRVVFRP